MRQHTPLIIVGEDGGARLLAPISLSANKNAGGYDEAWVRDMLFAHPETIPVNELDSAFGPMIPVCTELDTRTAGFADAIYINSLGLVTLAEAKLWRNPEARREVVGQILDYARVLRRWTYNDLQREAARARKEPGFNLFKHVHQRHPDLDETAFVDAVSRNLAQGRLLLLIIGDGIRTGVEAIAEYVQEHAGLHFTFGLVETAIYELGHGQLVVQPRVLAKTQITTRTIVDIRSPEILVLADRPGAAPDAASGEKPLSDREKWSKAFSEDLIATVKLDDADQPLARPTPNSAIFFMFPTSGQIWITAYFS